MCSGGGSRDLSTRRSNTFLFALRALISEPGVYDSFRLFRGTNESALSNGILGGREAPGSGLGNRGWIMSLAIGVARRKAKGPRTGPPLPPKAFGLGQRARRREGGRRNEYLPGRFRGQDGVCLTETGERRAAGRRCSMRVLVLASCGR